MSLSLALLDGSNTTTTPREDASAANASVPRDRRSKKNTDAPPIAGLTLSAESTEIALKAGSHLPHFGQPDHGGTGQQWIVGGTGIGRENWGVSE